MHLFRSVYLLSAARVVLLADVPSASAQRAPGAPRDTVAALPLDTVRIRVLRVPVVAARAPYAVSVVSAREIGRAKPGLALDEALRAVPGVQVESRYNYAVGERVSIRGFGARAQFGVRGVRVVYDGIPATAPDGQTTLNQVDLGALVRAEVIRGPAAALYGNAAGGVILLTSASPPATPYGAEYQATAGSDGLLRLRTAAGGTVGAVSYQASIMRLGYDGYREQQGARNLLGSARLGFRGTPGDFSLVLHTVNYDARNPGSLSDSLLRMDRRQAFSGNRRDRTGETGRHRELGATWERRVAGATLNASAYGVARALDNPIPSRVIELSRRSGGATLTVRSSDEAPLRWALGAEAAGQRDDRRNYANIAGGRGDLRLDQLERVRALSGFARAGASLGARVELLGALRYDGFRFSARDRIAATAGNPDDSGRRDMAAWSPTVGLSVGVAPALRAYANIATAFETPTTTELANTPGGAGGFNAALQPQRTRSLETGVKGSIGALVSYDIAAYRARVRGALIPFEVAAAPGRQFFRNAGSAVHRGVEAGVAVGPRAGLSGRLAYTWTDARFGTYEVDTVSYRGRRVPGVTPHRVDGLLGWTSARGPFAEMAGRYSSAVAVDDANRFFSPAYTVFDVRLGWENANLAWGRATPFVGVTNLLGRQYNTSVVVNAFGQRYFEPGPGRALYVGVEVRLGG